ncbi:NUDIX hydrolase [Zunongwangia atlantica]|uniref:NUDIX domain-containing protein n=1 Tax=Zunongwangia atlantica 22II14-10F7 TaxID=1185767 RepID=A0A1Y1T3E3_9FLAO|nr:CoA pyrophosphatase [Zunongwangia atlantica]ORL45558.1 NUDIX domain-containing protein [Zunongwangia atlantica 22II14-10F7]
MDFFEFKNRISNLKKIDLPGELAHNKLAPSIRVQELKKIDFSAKKTNKAGVMAVFYPKNSQTYFVLILRKTYKGVHSNQVGFPGGRVEEEDRDLAETALRETEEEVGIPQDKIEVIRELSKLYIPPSNFWVHPFVGILEETPNLIPQESEVEDILEVKLSDFLSEESFVTRNLSTSYMKNIDVPAFLLNDQIVWGATGMMLGELREMLQEIL